MRIGHHIQRLRKENRISRRTLAEKADISEASIKRYENNERQPTVDVLNRIAKALGVSYIDLLDDETAEKEKKNRRITQKQIDSLNTIWKISAHMDEVNALHGVIDKRLNVAGQKKVIEYTMDLIAHKKYLKPGIKPFVKDEDGDNGEPQQEDNTDAKT